MKKVRLLSILVFFASAAGAEDCRLNLPIPIKRNLFYEDITLRDVQLNAIPRFDRPSNYDPVKNALFLDIFNIEHNEVRKGALGLTLWVPDNNESVGFANIYSGKFDIESHYEERGGITTYTTKKVDRYTGAEHAKGDAITEARVTVSRNLITSIRLMFPVFKVWRNDGTADHMAFTGEHQTLCVLSGRYP